MKKGHQLPIGYQPIDSLPIATEKTYILPYESEQEAVGKLNQLQNNYPSLLYNIEVIVEPHPVEYNLIVPLGALKYLTPEEQSLAEPYFAPIQYNVYSPILYRFFSKEEYIDNYVEKGELMLSTFARCKKLEDATRCDGKEGMSTLIGEEEEYRVEMSMGVGDNAFMLCTTLSNSYKDGSGIVADRYLEIFDIQGLIQAITKQLVDDGYDVHQVLCGPCTYSNKTLEGRLDGDVKKMLDLMETTHTFNPEYMIAMQSKIGGPHMYFQKPIEKAVECEYRILWLVENLHGSETKKVTIPEPKKYARKVVVKSVNHQRENTVEWFD